MFEVLVVALTLFCNAPEPLPNDYVSAVIESGVLMDEVYGSSHPYDLPTAPSEDGMLSYRIIVDPLYQTYKHCFIQEVRNILSDERSWPTVREAKDGETPQVWVILTPPGTCGTIEYPETSCAAGTIGGQGQIWMNYNRWSKGSSFEVQLSEDRAHVINHEVGHHLGFEHATCVIHGSGVMVPRSMTSNCQYQAWPTIHEKRALLDECRPDADDQNVQPESSLGCR